MPFSAQTLPTVLVVDDYPDLADMLAHFFSRQGMMPLVAYSGRQCLEIVRQKPIDVIVLDVMMPDMDGLEICAALRRMAPPLFIPVILLTAKDDLETRLAAMRLGVSEFLLKPTRGRDLLARIHTQLEVSWQTRVMERMLANSNVNIEV